MDGSFCRKLRASLEPRALCSPVMSARHSVSARIWFWRICDSVGPYITRCRVGGVPIGECNRKCNLFLSDPSHPMQLYAMCDYSESCAKSSVSLSGGAVWLVSSSVSERFCKPQVGGSIPLASSMKSTTYVFGRNYKLGRCY